MTIETADHILLVTMALVLVVLIVWIASLL